MSKANDLAFLREMSERLRDGRDRNDPTQLDFVELMIRDWIKELEPKIKAKGR